jgi:hypothetical protein
MKVSGLPQRHLDLIAQLEVMEAMFLEQNLMRPPALVAQGLTCIAHDYAQIGLEEKAHALLLKADEICPDYHKNEIKQHMAEHPEYAQLVVSLGNELALIMLSTARDNQ